MRNRIDIDKLDKAYFVEWSAKYDRDHPWWTEQEKILGEQLRNNRVIDRALLEKVLEWKFHTVKMWREKNLARLSGVPDSKIADASLKFFEEGSIEARIDSLKMDGIGVSVASVILTFCDPTEYCVHDTHVWRQVYGEPKGIHTVGHYLRLLDDLRKVSTRVGLPVRTVEKALFKQDYDSVF